MKTMVINRKKWYRGNIDGSRLERISDGKRCCLGFLGQKFGADLFYNDAEIPIPSLSKDFDRFPKKLFEKSWYFDGSAILWENTLAVINDYPNIDEPTREAWIKEGFKRLFKINVKFVG